MKAQQREFWVPPGTRALPSPGEAFQEVVLLQAVTHTLRQHLTSPARIRGGLLFGFQASHALHVLLASSAGSPGWYPAASRDILEIDPRFTVGWSEALASVWPGRMDWIGNWMAHADNQSHPVKHDHRRVRKGFKLGVLDDRSVLLLPGWNEGILEMRCYTLDPDGHAVELPCYVSSQPLTDAVQALTTGQGEQPVEPEP